MKLTKTKIDGCFVIDPYFANDNRGHFVKIFNSSSFEKAAGFSFIAKEVFYSNSKKNVLRGMHFQTHPHEIEKIIFCQNGEVLDVFLDIRKDSPTYGKFDCQIISEANHKAVFIPKGIAHGFLTLSDNSIVSYLQSGEYNSQADSGILWNSFGMDWAIDNPIISDRDKEFIKLSDF